MGYYYYIYELRDIESPEEREPRGYILAGEKRFILKMFCTFVGWVHPLRGESYTKILEKAIPLDDQIFNHKEEIYTIYGINAALDEMHKDVILHGSTSRGAMEHSIIRERYIEFLRWTEQRTSEKHNMKVKFAESDRGEGDNWDYETNECMINLWTPTSRLAAKGESFTTYEEFLVGFFLKAYQKWIEEGHPAIIHYGEYQKQLGKS